MVSLDSIFGLDLSAMALKPLINEKELLQQIAEGDEYAFAELFRGYSEPLAQYVYTLLESVQMCEEIVQDVFAQVWETREALPSLDRFSSYLFIITRNYTLNCIRKMAGDKKRGEIYVNDLLHQDTGESFIMDEEYQNVLNRAVVQLPPSQQKVLMYRQQGLKTREIAEKMGLTTDSVKKIQQWAASSVTKFLKSRKAQSLILVLVKV